MGTVLGFFRLYFSFFSSFSFFEKKDMKSALLALGIVQLVHDSIAFAPCDNSEQRDTSVTCGLEKWSGNKKYDGGIPYKCDPNTDTNDKNSKWCFVTTQPKIVV